MTRQDFQVYLRTLERMLAAGWITAYRFTERTGLQIQWNNAELKSVRLLKRIVKSFQLNASHAQAARFDQMCENCLRQHSTPGAIDPELARFWRDCLNELNLSRDERDFICLMHGILDFGPEEMSESDVPTQEFTRSNQARACAELPLKRVDSRGRKTAGD